MKLQCVATQRVPFEHVIIAGGDDDVGTSDLIHWISPVLAGLPRSRWITAEMTLQPARRLSVQCRFGQSPGPALELHGFGGNDLRTLEDHLPSADAVLVMLDHCVPQVMTLLDTTARWVMAFDSEATELTPLLPLIDRICASAAIAKAQNRKGPVAGALLKPAAE